MKIRFLLDKGFWIKDMIKGYGKEFISVFSGRFCTKKSGGGLVRKMIFDLFIK